MKQKNKSNKVMLIAAAVLVVLAAGFAIKDFVAPKQSSAVIPGTGSSAGAAVSQSGVSVNESTGDLVIDKNKITATASFFPYKMNGTQMEVFAVKATDGTIRTAFNTCQVCYDSGRGYYKLDGDTLVCQNCGNRFSPDQVELQRGGCNPVGITKEYKTETDSSITIKKDFFQKTQEIFANWKKS